jgi:hypothetical protein
MPGIEGAECEDHDEREAGRVGSGGRRTSALGRRNRIFVNTKGSKVRSPVFYWLLCFLWLRCVHLFERRWFDRQRRLCRIGMQFFPGGGLCGPPNPTHFCRSGGNCRSLNPGHRGGIGRRAWFRSMYPQGCGGSSPFDGTSSIL